MTQLLARDIWLHLADKYPNPADLPGLTSLRKENLKEFIRSIKHSKNATDPGDYPEKPSKLLPGRRLLDLDSDGTTAKAEAFAAGVERYKTALKACGESYTAYAKAPSLDGWLAALDEILKTKSPPSDFENVDCETWYLPKEIARHRIRYGVNIDLSLFDEDEETDSSASTPVKKRKVDDKSNPGPSPKQRKEEGNEVQL